MLVAERTQGVDPEERLGAPGARGALDVLETAAAVAAGEVWAGRPGPVLAAALRQVTSAERMVGAAKVAVLGAFDASGEFRVDRHPSTATWVAAKTKSDRRRVRHQVGVARQLWSMALTEGAFRAGLIGFEHVAVLCRACTPKVAELFVEAEGELVAAARTLDFDLFCRAVRAWRDFVDPDGAGERARAQDERREGHASRTFDGMVRLDGWLEAIGGTEFLAELRRLERFLFDADWAEARARVGENATVGDLRRTAAQRRADAFVEMARRSATCDTPGQPPKWVLNVMMGHATFCAETAAATATAGPGPGPGPESCTCHGDPPATQADDGDESDTHPLDDLDEATDSDIGADLDDSDSGADLDDRDDDDRDDDDRDDRDDDDRDDRDDDDRDDLGAEPGAPAGPQPGGPASPSTGPLPDWWKAPDPFAGTGYYDTMCELEDCTPIAPSQALSLGLAGTIRRVVFGPDSHILDFGEAKDYFTGPLREAIIIRDRFCKDEGCGVPGRDCHIDHVIPRSRGGPTSERNGQCKCGTANRIKGNRMP